MNANTIADFFIYYSHNSGDLITNLKLQKLVYYAQAWHLSLNDTELFSEEIEAWVHGPVIPSVYQKYRKYTYNPIPEQSAKPELSVDMAKFLIGVYNIYGKYTAYQLELMTHQEEPWEQAQNYLHPGEYSNEIIPKEEMKRFYSNLINE